MEADTSLKTGFIFPGHGSRNGRRWLHKPSYRRTQSLSGRDYWPLEVFEKEKMILNFSVQS